MTKVVYVGGFGGGRSSGERVANALGQYYENVEAFRFSDLEANPDSIRKASVGANIITHSAGALALKLDLMSRIDTALLLGPPLPQRMSQLLYRTAVKTARMNTPGIGIKNLQDVASVANYSASTLAELTMNPVHNLGRLQEIAYTNTVDFAEEAHENHTPLTAVWSPGDAYFKPSGFDLVQMRLNKAAVITDIEGEHDEVILRPEQFLSQVLER